jgi:hypothetical protein
MLKQIAQTLLISLIAMNACYAMEDEPTRETLVYRLPSPEKLQEVVRTYGLNPKTEDGKDRIFTEDGVKFRYGTFEAEMPNTYGFIAFYVLGVKTSDLYEENWDTSFYVHHRHGFENLDKTKNFLYYVYFSLKKFELDYKPESYSTDLTDNYYYAISEENRHHYIRLHIVGFEDLQGNPIEKGDVCKYVANRRINHNGFFLAYNTMREDIRSSMKDVLSKDGNSLNSDVFTFKIE